MATKRKARSGGVSNSHRHDTKIANKVMEKFWSFEHQFRDKLIVLVVSAFGLVAALTWNKVIEELILELAPGAETLFWRVIAATLITIFAVIVTVVLTSFKPKSQ